VDGQKFLYLLGIVVILGAIGFLLWLIPKSLKRGYLLLPAFHMGWLRCFLDEPQYRIYRDKDPFGYWSRTGLALAVMMYISFVGLVAVYHLSLELAGAASISCHDYPTTATCANEVAKLQAEHHEDAASNRRPQW
jgi:hypothetical protein